MLRISLVLVLLVGAGMGVAWFFHGSDPKSDSKVLAEKNSRSASPTRSTPSPTLAKSTIASAIRTSRSGVVRIEMTTCNESWVGSGFLVAPGLVATVEHVVDKYRTLAVRSDAGVTRAVVVGADPGQEVALLRLKYPLPGHVFAFATQPPLEGSALAVLGYPLGRPLTSTDGTVGALDRKIDVTVESGSRALRGMVQFDAATNPGSSGGPLIDRESRVLGMTEAGQANANGQNYAVSATKAAPLIDSWRTSAAEIAPQSCRASSDDLIADNSRHPDAPELANVLASYYGGLNEGNNADTLHRYAPNTAPTGFEEAWRLLSGELRAKFASFDAFRASKLTSEISHVALEQAAFVNATTDTADVRFTSTQAAAQGPSGQTCSRWHLRYTMTLDSGMWTIDRATPLGTTPVDCS